LENPEPLAIIGSGTSELFSKSFIGNGNGNDYDPTPNSTAYYSTREYAGLIGKTVPDSTVQCSGGPKI
jgi:hypothetical protein